MQNIRLIRAAVKPAKRHEQTDRQTDRQTDANFIYIDIRTQFDKDNVPHRIETTLAYNK